MKTRITIGLFLAPVLLCYSPLVFAQEQDSQDQESLQQAIALHSDRNPDSSNQIRHMFSQAELDQMLAPIALYPDSLLSQILMASTYPLEVVEAARWSKAHPELKGEDAVQAVEEYSWDLSVKSLVAFPQVIATMDERLEWMQRLGDAFLSQEQDVMDAIQNLRQKAASAGNLSSNDQMRVDQQGESIVIEPADPQVVYIPYYDPVLVYGAWWWPAYPPVYWSPWSSYFVGPVSRFGVGYYWSFGVPIGPRCWFGAFNWPYRHVTFGSGLVWVHSPIHRRSVPYRDYSLQQRFGRSRGSIATIPQFRGGGATPFLGQRSFGRHAVPHPNAGNRPGIHGNLQGRLNAPNLNRPNVNRVPSGPSQFRGRGSNFDRRAPSMGSMRRGVPQRHFNAPGRTGSQSSAPRLHGGGSRGGGRGYGHGGGRGGGRGGGGRGGHR